MSVASFAKSSPGVSPGMSVASFAKSSPGVSLNHNEPRRGRFVR